MHTVYTYERDASVASFNPPKGILPDAHKADDAARHQRDEFQSPEGDSA